MQNYGVSYILDSFLRKGRHYLYTEAMHEYEDITSMDNRAVELLTLLRLQGAQTRASIAESTGWARPTVNKHLERLVDVGLAIPSHIANPTGGRPAQGFEFNPNAACILSIDIATAHTTLALCNLAGDVLSSQKIPYGAEQDPNNVLTTQCQTADTLLADTGHGTLCAVSIAVTTRVEEPTGQIIEAPVMRRWEHRDLPDFFKSRYHVPAFIENDANIRALYKARRLAGPKERQITDLIYIHAGMGLGAGIISCGTVLHGARGGAGDIGHIHVFGEAGKNNPCRCGNTGCVEASAGGWAIIQNLKDSERDVDTLIDVISLVRQRDVEAIRQIRQAGRLIGDVVSAAINLLNPSHVVIGGELSQCGELFMSGIRERIWGRTQPLATKNLHIDACPDDSHAGVVGLAYAAADKVLQDTSFVNGAFLGSVLDAAGTAQD